MTAVNKANGMAGEDRADLCVIGGGAAGHAVALAAAALGARCTLIDPAERLGRSQAADLAEALFLEAAIGHRSAAPFDWPGFRRGLGLALAADYANHTAARLATLGVKVIRGTARFIDGRTVEVDAMPIRAGRFILATGATSPAAKAPPIRPADLLVRDGLPGAITIVAAVPAGLAWAQALARLGTAVTLRLEPGALGGFDPELLQFVLDALRRDGVELQTRTATATAAPPGGPATMVFAQSVPATAALGLAAAGIACRSDGAPFVDRRLRTANRRVFALGAVLGMEAAQTGTLAQQVALVLRTALFRLPVLAAVPPAPDTLRTDPAIAQIGRLVSAASAERRVVLRFPLAETMPGTLGLAKIVASRSGRIHGAGLVGPGALEAIAPWGLAIARGVPLGTMAAVPAPPGTLAEAGRRAALGFVTERLRDPRIRRLIVAFRRFA